MHDLLRNKVAEKFDSPVNTSKDCDLLSESILIATKRKVSSTTLRRFFGLLPSKSNISAYNLDTLAIYIGNKDYNTFCKEHDTNTTEKREQDDKQINKIHQITQHTLNSIYKKSLTKFENTIPREDINSKLNNFLNSDFSIFPVIAPGGYGKSIALAHWVKELDTNIYECLFCSASIFYQLISDQNNVNHSLNLNLNTSNNLFEIFSNRNIASGKKLIIVLDSIDEISIYAKKYKEFIDFLIKVQDQYLYKSSIKIIFSIREATWSNLMVSDINKLYNNKNLFNIKISLESGSGNIPALSNSEINEIFKLHNRDLEQAIILNSISWMLQDLIKTPINLHYLIALYNKKNKFEVVSANNLYREYLKELISLSKYAEYKEDIIWKTIELIDNAQNEFVINKNDLKKIYPIHLKRETEFFNAYGDLLKDGILSEERNENDYGIYTTKVGFKHQNFYYYLSTLKQIQNNDRLNYTLLSSICNSTNNHEWITNVISVLFEIAYENEDYNTLENFCQLPEKVLASLPIRFSVGNSFRIQNSIRDRLIQKFASCPIGQVYFFEQFVDTNYMYNNFEYRVTQYLKYKNTTEAGLFGNTILFLSGFLAMNKETCKKQFKLIENIEPDTSIHPWPIGRKVACHILNTHFIENKKIDNLSDFITKHQSVAYAYDNYLSFGLVEFELPILIALLLTKRYELIVNLVQISIKSYDLDYSKENFSKIDSVNQNILPYIFAEYAKFKMSEDFSSNLRVILEKTVDAFPSTFDDFQYKILLKYFLFDFLAHNGNIVQAQEYFDSALELSKFAEYDFYTSFLLINNPTKDSELIQEAEEMLKESGFRL